MAYVLNTLPGAQPLSETSTVKKHLLGTIVRGTDPTLGEGEFIYLQGIGSTVVGSIVSYGVGFVTALDTAAATGPSNPLAIAMSANVASQYGWYQISGNAVIKKTTVAVSPGVPIFLAADASAGRFKVLASAGQQILGAQTANLATIVTTTSTVVVTINRPFTQGQIT